jgi:hypothetical protein
MSKSKSKSSESEVEKWKGHLPVEEGSKEKLESRKQEYQKWFIPGGDSWYELVFWGIKRLVIAPLWMGFVLIGLKYLSGWSSLVLLVGIVPVIVFAGVSYLEWKSCSLWVSCSWGLIIFSLVISLPHLSRLFGV